MITERPEDDFDDPEAVSLEEEADEFDQEEIEEDPAYNPDDEDLQRLKGG